ncbi:hypothetical protein ABG79_02168 [Caloramator mitchellensis]|uniref:Uncharacterized protein n=1 Tax=Caloramator mitchellensis TaxID=908809 RepID=A0A0R3JY38_CALMK|nr:hypothetical protein [Caloramator mitchellensis]KRQ86036.1 hypothetical protein ABG79_02168 [Caloramator mitchellensis]
MKDLTPQELEQELLRVKDELSKARERMNQRAEEYRQATREYKAEYAKAFLEAKLEKSTVKECEIYAMMKTAGLEARYKAAEQLVLNERKAVDVLIEECEILRSLYSKAYKEQEQYGRRED